MAEKLDFLLPDLGDGEVEAVAHAPADGLHHAALLLEGTRARDLDLDRRGPDDHPSVAGFSSTTKASITSPILTSL